MSVLFCLFGTKLGRSSKVIVKLPCSPQAVGAAVAEDAGKGLDEPAEVIVLERLGIVEYP